MISAGTLTEQITETYQDLWVKGECVRPGVRECAERYELVRRFCAQYRRPFTVLDLGANLGYFSVRLAEDFPECTVVAVEGRSDLGAVLESNQQPRVLWLRKMLSPQELWELGEVEAFDVVLALSVAHHLDGDPQAIWEALSKLGDHLIAEVPTEAAACNPERVAGIRDAVGHWCAPVVLGQAASHLDPEATRPILRWTHVRPGLRRRYLGDTRDRPVAVEIKSNFERKVFRHTERSERREWHRGINLQTFLKLGGAWPPRAWIAQAVLAAWDRAVPHGDLAVWNCVLGGDSAVLIDGADPNTLEGYSDAVGMESILRAILGQQ